MAFAAPAIGREIGRGYGVSGTQFAQNEVKRFYT